MLPPFIDLMKQKQFEITDNIMTGMLRVAAREGKLEFMDNLIDEYLQSGKSITPHMFAVSTYFRRRIRPTVFKLELIGLFPGET